MITDTLVAATIGGMLIGLSAVLLLWLNGRIAGISGILYGAVARDPDGRLWRILFVIGLVAGGWAYATATGEPLMTREGFPTWILLLGGFLVGVGTRLGSGCTSGHGVCGISRLSLRSVIATLAFVAAGIVTATSVELIAGIPA